MAILATEKVLTLDYWKPAAKLQVGDHVLDRNGNLARVTLVQTFHSSQCYEVQFNDHLTIGGDTRLEFDTENPKYRMRLRSYKGKRQFKRPLRPLSVEQMLDIPLVDHRNRKLYSVPTAGPLQMPYQDLPVPPFIFGFWFFARRSTKAMAPARGTRDYVLEKFRDHGYKTREHELLDTGERDFTVTPSIEVQLSPGVPTRIPNNYLLSSEEQRKELLSGIICAKNRQYNEKTDFFRVTSTNYGTITRIQGLVESLGSKTTIMFDDYLKNYTLFFKSRMRLIPNQVSPPVKVHHARRFITKINPLPPQLCVHVETTGENNSILVGEGFIPCH